MSATKKRSPATTREVNSALSAAAPRATGRPRERVTAWSRTSVSLIAKVAVIAVIAPATMSVTSVPSTARTASVRPIAATVRSPAVSRSNPGSDAANRSHIMAPPRRRTALTLHFLPLAATIHVPFSIARRGTGGPTQADMRYGPGPSVGCSAPGRRSKP